MSQHKNNKKTKSRNKKLPLPIIILFGGGCCYCSVHFCINKPSKSGGDAGGFTC
jgi:hypothetical protein